MPGSKPGALPLGDGPICLRVSTCYQRLLAFGGSCQDPIIINLAGALPLGDGPLCLRVSTRYQRLLAFRGSCQDPIIINLVQRCHLIAAGLNPFIAF
jgi:hypothetical protein